MGMTKQLGPFWTKPRLAMIMRDNHAAAEAQEAHALEDVLAARERAKAARPTWRRRLRALFAGHGGH